MILTEALVIAGVAVVSALLGFFVGFEFCWQKHMLNSKPRIQRTRRYIINRSTEKKTIH